jgi:hypothetical protein
MRAIHGRRGRVKACLDNIHVEDKGLAAGGEQREEGKCR